MERFRPAGRIPAALFALALVLGACGRPAASAGGSSSTASTRSPSASAGASGAPTGSPAATFPLTLSDDDGVSVTFASAPQRIVTFAPANTEILFALGLGARVVGVSGTYDDYPPEAKGLPEVGGAGSFGVDPNIEQVVGLHPDLMLTTSGGEQWKARLRQLGITVFAINATDFTDLLHDIGTVGRITGAVAPAATLVASMQAKATDIGAKVAGEARVSCFYEVYYPPLTTVGPHTFLFDLLQRAGCDPVTAGAKAPYPTWSLERLVTEDPQVYLLDSLSGSTPQAVAKRSGFAAIGAIKGGRVIVIDSDLVTRPGPRIVDGLLALAQALHPDAFAAP
jgi:iron complex transport system substrate-binding protein